jgi:hypothetical protein
VTPVNSHPISFKFCSKIILPSMPKSSKWSLPFGLSDQNFVNISHLSHASQKPWPPHPPWFDYSTNIWWNKLWSSSLCSLL